RTDPVCSSLNRYRSGDAGTEGELADFVGGSQGEPQIAVRAGGNRERAAVDRKCKLGDGPCRCDSAEIVPNALDEPNVSIGTCSYSDRCATTGGNREFRDRSGRRHSTDLVAVLFRKP